MTIRFSYSLDIWGRAWEKMLRQYKF